MEQRPADAAGVALDREAPEHRSERRRFIAWALMVGATTPQVVVGAVLADIEREREGEA